MGFKAGVSYSPDSEQRGTVSRTQSVFRSVAADPSLTGYKNVWEGGLRYKGMFDKVGIRASLMGNAGDAKDFRRGADTAATTENHLLRHDLRAWEAGGAISYMGFTLAGSYADMGKSGTVKTRDGVNGLTGKKKANFWNIGASYEHQMFGASVTYMESRHGAAAVRATSGGRVASSSGTDSIVTLDSSNKYTALSFGVDYKLAPGFMPYAEVTRFELKQGRPNQVVNTELETTTRYKNSGFVVLAGTKLHF